MATIKLSNEELVIVAISMFEIAKLTKQGKTNWQSEYAEELYNIAKKFQDKHSEVALNY